MEWRMELMEVLGEIVKGRRGGRDGVGAERRRVEGEERREE